MKVTMWYHTSDRQPPKSDYYLCYRGWGMAGKADGDSDTGYLWYDLKRNEWRDYTSTSIGHSALVYYWTEADPSRWVDEDSPVSRRVQSAEQMPAAEKIAYDQMMAAIDHYKVVKALTNGID